MDQLTELDKATIFKALVSRNTELTDHKSRATFKEIQNAIQAEIEYIENLILKILDH